MVTYWGVCEGLEQNWNYRSLGPGLTVAGQGPKPAKALLQNGLCTREKIQSFPSRPRIGNSSPLSSFGLSPEVSDNLRRVFVKPSAERASKGLKKVIIKIKI